MLKIECNEKRPRFETEPLEDGRTLVRLYEGEEAASRPAVSDMDTPWNGYRYTTYETRIALPAGALETAPDIWAEAVKQADRLFQYILDVASGRVHAKSEALDKHELAIFKNGVTL